MRRLHDCLVSLLLASVLGAATSAALATEQRPLFRLDGLDYDQADLSPELRQKVFEAYVSYRDRIAEVVRDAAFELHIEEQARRSGNSVEQVRSGLLPDGPVAEEQVQAFYRANEARIRMPYAQVRGQIEEYLAAARDTQAREKVVAALREDGALDDLLPAAEAPLQRIETAGFPSKGPDTAPVTVVEFADYQCPHCKAALPHVAALLERYPDQVRIVFMDFPVNPSGVSRKVARGAVCAQRQERFWDYHDLAFAQQDTLDDAAPARLARAVGLDMAQFEACYASAQTGERVNLAEREAQRLGVSGTPTLFVNGQRLRVTTGLAEDLEAAVRAALRAAGA